MGLFFSAEPVTNCEEAQAAKTQRYAAFFHGLLEQGIYLAPSGFETTFVSAAHTDDDIDATIAAAVKVFTALA